MKLNEQLGAWAPLLAPMLEESWCKDLFAQVDAAYQAGDPPVYPPQEDLFTALRLTPPEAVRCVILGQDPYHEPGQAHGLAFSVEKGVKIPPSLRNIYAELESDLGCYTPNHGCLTSWAEHGVLLLNNVLTVYQGKANSHKKWGWQKFTAGILAAVQTLPQPVAYLLWGRDAQQKTKKLPESDAPRFVLATAHPSPLSATRGFLGSRPFSQVNRFLVSAGDDPIPWWEL